MASSDTRLPAGGAVVIGPLSQATQARLEQATLGKLSQISSSPPMLLVEANDDPRALCTRINAVIGIEGLVVPVLENTEGNRLFPTGRLQVRFEEPPGDNLLSAFAQRHGVDLTKRNIWAPQQVEFTIRPEDKRFLPDITAAMGTEQGVVAAWPDAKAAFRRG